MRLHCKVEVHNRMLSLTLKRKPQCSLLTIGRHLAKADAYIFLQTLQNKKGVKYKIINNIEQVFMKFVGDGKTTIRLKEPCHDLIIQGDAIQLKSFLRILKLALSRKNDLSSIPIISNLDPKRMRSQPNTKVLVKRTSEYSLTGFPKKTTELIMNNLQQKTFDRQILRLQSLKVLNLSDNKIVSLPMEVGSCLPHLKELIISNNRLGRSAKWTWLDQDAIRKSLLFLDMRNNSITELPKQVGKLGALKHLKICENMLTCLPQTIGALYKLEYLYVSKNTLSCLPGSIRILRLTYLDISNNPFLNHGHDVEHSNITIPTLTEYSARSFLKTGSQYNSKLIPSTLIAYLDDAKYCCICGSACFESYIRKYVQRDLKDISSEIKHTLRERNELNLDCYFCSLACSYQLKN